MADIVDCNGAPLALDSKVQILGGRDGQPTVGMVSYLGSPDGDIDDEGRPFGISPKVTVRYGASFEEKFDTYWTATGPWDDDAPYQCDELELITFSVNIREDLDGTPLLVMHKELSFEEATDIVGKLLLKMTAGHAIEIDVRAVGSKP